MIPMVKVYFRLTQDDDDYPPVSTESVWATPGPKPGEYILNNIPFFVREATIGDIVTATDEDGVRWFDALVCRSSNSLLRAVLFIEDQMERVALHLTRMGCSVEYMKTYKLLAINVPENVRLTSIQEFLGKEATSGTLDYEEPILRQ